MPSVAAPDRRWFERIYRRYNHHEWVHSDPLGYVYAYPDAADREIVGLLASSLAFGRVVQIRRSLERLLGLLGSPAALLEGANRRRLGRMLSGYRHRFVTGADVADLLEGARRLRHRWGTLNRYFVERCYDPTGGDMVAAVTRLQKGLAQAREGPNYLLPDPRRGSACKRLHLFLRWMVRSDEVDPGVWSGVRPGDLIVPMDTHMHRICRLLGMVDRRQADLRAAREATEGFRRIRADDPVRYDFALTRMGMSGNLAEIPSGEAVRTMSARLVRGSGTVVP